jgi:hypothetical protein
MINHILIEVASVCCLDVGWVLPFHWWWFWLGVHCWLWVIQQWIHLIIINGCNLLVLVCLRDIIVLGWQLTRCTAEMMLEISTLPLKLVFTLFRG